MTSLIADLNQILEPRNAHTLQDTYYSIDQLNDFLKEAYHLNARTSSLLTYLRQIRRPYLSTTPAPRHQRRLKQSHTSTSTSTSNPISSVQIPQDTHLTDTDRDSIDSTTKSLLRDLHAGLSQLKSAEQIRLQTESAISTKRRWRAGGGILGSWAAGGGVTEKSPEELDEESKHNTIKLHREGVIWFLERGLEQAGAFQGEMMEVRIKREVERQKSSLYQASTTSSLGGVDSMADGWDGGVTANGTFKSNTALSIDELERERKRGQLSRNTGAEEDMDDKQLQALQLENSNLIKHYNSKMDQVRTVEKSLLEISELQSTLSINLSTQEAQIEQLISDSLMTGENVGSGNKELKKASERKSTAKAVFWTTVGVCSFFVVWDALI